MSQGFVGSSPGETPNARRKSSASAPSLETMKNRFPTSHRNGWRQRFVAIARQADAARRGPPRGDEGAPHRPRDPSARAAIRVRFVAISSH
jgi:hypothetical protein